jgi:uncharacterized protein
MFYLDTSLLVSSMTPEAASGQVQLWLAQQKTGTLQISRWTTTEFSSALSLKIRTGQINLAQRADAIAAFAEMKLRSLALVEVAPHHFDSAARLADNAALGLRAAEALHLAISMDLGATLCTLDRKLAEAAATVSAKVSMP